MKKTIVAVLLLTAFALAKDKNPADYPLTGTVTSFHAQAETGGFSDPNSGMVFVGTTERRVYVVKTDSGTIEITGLRGRFKDRTGPPALTVGETLKYRSDKTCVYVLEDGKEHRYYLMSAQ